MPVNLGGAHPFDQIRCDLCGLVYAKALVEEHHLIKRSSGGKDTRENLLRLDANCHTAIHQMEFAYKSLMNPTSKRKIQPSDLATQLFPNNNLVQKKLIEFGGIAAIGRDDAPTRATDYSAFDTDDLVQLPAVRVHPHVKNIVKVLAKEMKGPSGRAIGVSGYIEALIYKELRARGIDPTPPKR